MSCNKNTSRNTIKLLQDFGNISTITFGSCPRSYVRMELSIFEKRSNILQLLMKLHIPTSLETDLT